MKRLDAAWSKSRVPAFVGYGLASGGVALLTALIAVVPGADHIANVSLLYLLVVIGAAHRFGRGSAVFASLLAVLSFDWFFVAPRYTLTVDNPAEWLALVVFLVTAMVISQLTTTLGLRVEEAHQRERETAALAEASWAIASQVSHPQALAEVLRRLIDVTSGEVAAIVTPVVDGQSDVRFQVVSAWVQPGRVLPDFNGEPERDRVQEVWQGGAAPVLDSSLDPNASYLALMIEGRVLGVLYLRLSAGQSLGGPQRRVVESLANHAAVSLERHRLAEAEAQTQALAEADRLKTALLSMVSHDFRSPLASIKASVTGLLQEGAPWEAAAQRELLGGINQETDRLNAMVGNILALSRLEAGAWQPQCESVLLAEVVGAALDRFSAAKNKRIQVHLDSDLTEVWLDSVQIVQVLTNLLENALKYSPDSSPVELRARREAEWLVVEVADQGVGLEPGEETRIFDRFYRAPRWRESSLPGTGIGLAICRGLVEAHGGRLEACNNADGGALFCMTLPLREG